VQFGGRRGYCRRTGFGSGSPREFKKLAEAKGWTIDATADLARVLRLPGTINHKSDPIQVTVDLPETVHCYSRAEIIQELAASTPQPAPKPWTVGTSIVGNLDDDAPIRKAMAAANGAKFRELWKGSLNGHSSQSEATRQRKR
jgi:hypothetical protein